jgi:hypothetical protein
MSVGLANHPPLFEQEESPFRVGILGFASLSGHSQISSSVEKLTVFLISLVFVAGTGVIEKEPIGGIDFDTISGVRRAVANDVGHRTINIRFEGWGCQSGLSFDVLPLRSPTEGVRFGLDKVGEGQEVREASLLILITGLDSHTFNQRRFFFHPISLLRIPQALGHRTLPEMAIVSSRVEDVISERNRGG